MLGFRLDGKMPLPHPEFDCERVRYEHRFAPFSCMLTPPPVQYAEFYDMTLSLQHSHSQGLYMHGCKHFHQARSLLESIANPDNEVSLMFSRSHKRSEATRPFRVVVPNQWVLGSSLLGRGCWLKLKK